MVFRAVKGVELAKLMLVLWLTFVLPGLYLEPAGNQAIGNALLCGLRVGAQSLLLVHAAIQAIQAYRSRYCHEITLEDQRARALFYQSLNANRGKGTAGERLPPRLTGYRRTVHDALEYGLRRAGAKMDGSWQRSVLVWTQSGSTPKDPWPSKIRTVLLASFQVESRPEPLVKQVTVCVEKYANGHVSALGGLAREGWRKSGLYPDLINRPAAWDRSILDGLPFISFYCGPHGRPGDQHP